MNTTATRHGREAVLTMCLVSYRLTGTSVFAQTALSRGPFPNSHYRSRDRHSRHRPHGG